MNEENGNSRTDSIKDENNICRYIYNYHRYWLDRLRKKMPDSTKSKYTISDFEHPSTNLLQDIARKQGWQIEDVEARQRAFDALESNQQPTDADWQRLVKAADTEPNNFDLALIMEFSRHMTDNYRAPVLKWCERNMAQTNDPYAAVIGYACYIRSDGSGKDLWADRLKARGQFYVEKIAFYDKRAEARKKLDGNRTNNVP